MICCSRHYFPYPSGLVEGKDQIPNLYNREQERQHIKKASNPSFALGKMAEMHLSVQDNNFNDTGERLLTVQIFNGCFQDTILNMLMTVKSYFQFFNGEKKSEKIQENTPSLALQSKHLADHATNHNDNLHLVTYL